MSDHFIKSEGNLSQQVSLLGVSVVISHLSLSRSTDPQIPRGRHRLCVPPKSRELSAREKEVARLLHVPEDVTQTVMLPVAWARGARLRRASRLPARQLIAINRWQTD